MAQEDASTLQSCCCPIAMEDASTLRSIFTSATLPPRAFLAVRVFALGWLLGCGFALDWFPWSMRRPPVVFLTNWGFFVSTVHFLLSCVGLGAALRRTKDEESYPRVRSLARAVFATAIVVEPLIVLGFWTLVYSEEGAICSFSCLTMHGLCFCLLCVDAALNRLTIDFKPHYFVSLGYAALWTVSQIAWVYTGHAPDYQMVTFRDARTAIVVPGCAVVLSAAFLAARALLRCRDRRAARREDGAYGRLAPGPDV